VTLGKGFYQACEDIRPTRKYVVYSGTDRFPLQQGVEAIPLPQLAAEIQAR